MSGPGVRRHRSPGDAAPAASPTRRSSSFASLSVSNRHPRLVVKLELHRRGDEARASSPARCHEAPWHQVTLHRLLCVFASLRLCASTLSLSLRDVLFLAPDARDSFLRTLARNLRGGTWGNAEEEFVRAKTQRRKEEQREKRFHTEARRHGDKT